MRYEPHKDEYAAVPNMTDDELLEYFLYRIFETDEVWGLKEGAHIVTHQLEDQETLPVWAYKCYADDAAVGEWAHLKAVADSVEFFTYQTLHRFAGQGLMVEIMPRQSAPGCLINARRLSSMLENMMEARDHTLGD